MKLANPHPAQCRLIGAKLLFGPSHKKVSGCPS
jgi:hypothetical protein